MPAYTYPLSTSGARSKLEARITVPATGYDLTITEVGGGDLSDTITIPAGDYYHSSPDSTADDFVQTLEDLINAAALTGVYTVSVSAGVGGTGKYTITETGGTAVTSFGIVWDTDDLKDLLGFTQGNVIGFLTFMGDDHARALWLPDSAYQALNGEGAGWDESDLRDMENMNGGSFSFFGNEKTVNRIRWPTVKRHKVWLEFEPTGQVNGSFQRFYRDGIQGRAPWGLIAGGPIRWYPDADTDTFKHTYKVTRMPDFRPGAVQDNWTLLFAVVIPRLILQA